MQSWKKALIATTAIALSAMPMTEAFAQNNAGTSGMAPVPSQRIATNGGSDGASITPGPATVRRAQQELNRLGYDSGHVTGRWDRGSRQALIRFQKARDLEPTGTLDMVTLRALGVEPGVGMARRGGEYGARGGSFNGAYGANVNSPKRANGLIARGAMPTRPSEATTLNGTGASNRASANGGAREAGGHRSEGAVGSRSTGGAGAAAMGGYTSDNYAAPGVNGGGAGR